MPLYEYQCDACGKRFERIQKFSDPPASACPTCGGAVQKLISSPAFQFKGSGWYVTDYARKTEPTAAKPAAGSESADAKGSKDADTKTSTDTSSSSTESKPAATPAASAPATKT